MVVGSSAAVCVGSVGLGRVVGMGRAGSSLGAEGVALPVPTFVLSIVGVASHTVSAVPSVLSGSPLGYLSGPLQASLKKTALY